MENQGFDGHYAPDANPNYPYDQNGYFHNGMVYYDAMPPQPYDFQHVQVFNQPAPGYVNAPQSSYYGSYNQQQYAFPPQYQQQQQYQQIQQIQPSPNFQHVQYFNQPAPVYVPAPQPNYYGEYNQQQYEPPPQYQEQQLCQDNQNVMTSSEQRDQSLNKTGKLCDPCRKIIRNELIPVLHKLGCLEQPDIYEIKSDKPQVVNKMESEIRPLDATTVSQQPLETENVIETLPETLATEVVQQQEHEEIEVEFGQQPEDTVAHDKVDGREYQQIVPDESVQEISTSSETRVLEVSIDEPVFDIREIEFGYTPEAFVETVLSNPDLSIGEVVAFNGNEYVKGFSSLTQMEAGNTVKTSIISETLKKKLKKEKNVEKEDRGAEKQESAASPTSTNQQRKPAVKKQPAISKIQAEHRPTSSPPVFTNSNVSKSSAKADQNVSVPQKKYTTTVETEKRYMSKAERRQLNEEKSEREQQRASSMISKELAPVQTVHNSTDDESGTDSPPLAIENSSVEVEDVCKNAQEFELKEIQEIQSSQKVGEVAIVSTENLIPNVCSLEKDTPEDNPTRLINENKTEKVEVLSAKTRRLMFNANLRKQKNDRKGSLTKNGNVGNEQKKEDNTGQSNDKNSERNGISKQKQESENQTERNGTVSEQQSSLGSFEETSSNAEHGPNSSRRDVEEIVAFTSQFDDDLLNDFAHPVKDHTVFRKGAKADRLRKRKFWLSMLQTNFLKNYNLPKLGMHKEELRLVIYSRAMDSIRTKLLAFNFPTAPWDLLEIDKTGVGRMIFDKLSSFPYISRTPDLLKDYKNAVEDQREGSISETDAEKWEELFKHQEKLKLPRIYEDIVCLHQQGAMRIKDYSKWISLASSHYLANYNCRVLPTVEDIRKNLITIVNDEHLDNFINYIDRQNRVRFLGEKNIQLTKLEEPLSFFSQRYKGDRYKCNQEDSNRCFDEIIAALKNDTIKDLDGGEIIKIAVEFLSFLRRISSTIVTVDLFYYSIDLLGGTYEFDDIVVLINLWFDVNIRYQC